jgi:uncharacterized Zn-binding protein involved in type VI secretion
MPPAARMTDMHTCPMVTGLVPHVGGPITAPCAPTVLIGSLPAARATDLAVCAGGPDSIAMGSPTVLIMSLQAARIGDPSVHGGVIVMGLPTVMIGVAGLVGVEIVPDSFIGPLAPNQMRESEAVQALATLENIARGQSQVKITGSAEYQGQVLAALARLMSRPTGRALVNALDGAPHSTTIRSTAGGNSENAANWNNGLYNTAAGTAGPGSDNTVDWNANRSKINGEDWQTRDPAVGLGHELVHSYHDVNGTTDGRNSVPYTDANGNARNAPGYEQQAAGVGVHSGDPLTENNIRKEHDGSVSTLGRQEPPRPRY